MTAMYFFFCTGYRETHLHTHFHLKEVLATTHPVSTPGYYHISFGQYDLMTLPEKDITPPSLNDLPIGPWYIIYMM